MDSVWIVEENEPGNKEFPCVVVGVFATEELAMAFINDKEEEHKLDVEVAGEDTGLVTEVSWEAIQWEVKNA